MSAKLLLRLLIFFVLFNIGYEYVVTDQIEFPEFLLGIACIVSAILIIVTNK
jgi:hypothetical protein